MDVSSSRVLFEEWNEAFNRGRIKPTDARVLDYGQHRLFWIGSLDAIICDPSFHGSASVLRMWP